MKDNRNEKTAHERYVATESIAPKALFLLLFILSCSGAFSQTLEGKWEGWYGFRNNARATAVIKFQFQRDQDSAYAVYSFTQFKGHKAVCKMAYKSLNEHSIYLEETKLIRTTDSTSYPMFQKMTLTVNREFTKLQGTWFYKDGRLKYSGAVQLTKVMQR